MLEKLAMTEFVGRGVSDNGFLKGFWRFLNLKKNSSFRHFHLVEMVLRSRKF